MAEGVMIAFLPYGDLSWMQQSLPHMTLVYAGESSDLQATDYNTLAKDALTVARIMRRSFDLPVVEIQQLGNAQDGVVDALVLYPSPELLVARKLVAPWNKSEFTEFLPHVTIGPEGSAQGKLPSSLWFNRIGVFWDQQSILFDLESMY